MGAKCGCQILERYIDGKPRKRSGEKTWERFVHFCPLHKAAPELLEALKGLVEGEKPCCSNKHCKVHQARVVIRKAAPDA